MVSWLAGTALAFVVADQPVDRGGFDRLRAEVGGFVQPGFGLVEGDVEAGTSAVVGFEVAAARLQVDSALRPSSARGFGIAERVSVELAGQPHLEDAYLDLSVGAPLQLRIGQFEAPIHRSILTYDADALLPERDQVTSWVADREIGVDAHGWLGRRQLEWDLCVLDGEGANQVANLDQRLMYVARVVVAPWGSPGSDRELLLDDSPPGLSFGGSAFSDVTGPTGETDARWGWNAELFGHWRFLTSAAEHFEELHQFAEETIGDFRSVCTYAQVGAFLVGVPWAEQHLAVLGRIEHGDHAIALDRPVPVASPLDPNQANDRYTVGVGVFAGPPAFDEVQDLRVVASWTVRRELEDQPIRDDRFDLAMNLTF